MPQFVYSFWWVIFAVPLVPLIIHLINLLRHEQRPWAAMEFLLKSHKKHSQYVWLMQLLLLLMRMVIAAALVALLAQLTTPEFSFLRGQTTHHYVILDDTYSMGDRAAGESAWARAQQAVARIAANARQADGPQRFTLVRYSRAAMATPIAKEKLEGLPEGSVDPSVVDIAAQYIDLSFDEKLEEKRRTFELTQQSLSPLPAIRLVQQLVAAESNEKSLVYLVTDFRKNDWEDPKEVQTALQRLTQKAELQMVACVESQHSNLAITYLAPEDRTRAAGVPLFVDLHVRNYGKDVARDVQVKLSSTYYGPILKPNLDPLTLERKADELPPIFFKEIPPGQTAYARTQVYFPTAGEHVVEATLPDDAVTSDNRRWCVVDFPAGNPVLIVDGDPEGNNKFFLELVFSPGTEGGATAAAKTGIAPEVKTLQELRDMSADSLRRYHAVYLLGVPRFDVASTRPGAASAGGSDKADKEADPIVEKLEAYARSGGGVGIFLGPDIDVGYYNRQLYRGGAGFFPFLLGGAHVLPDPDDPEQPLIDFIDHPIFKSFSGDRNSSWRRLWVSEYFQPKPRGPGSIESAPAAAGKGSATKSEGAEEKNPTRTLATLYNGQPLMVERQYGDGKVITVLTSLSPKAREPRASGSGGSGKEIAWNNLVKEPAGIVLVLELQSYLQSTRRSAPPREVGTPLEIDVAADAFNPSIKFLVPQSSKPDAFTAITKEAAKPTKASTTMVAILGKQEGDAIRETSTSGVYEAWLKTSKGDPAPRRFAFNVDPKEGDLALVGQGVDEATLKSRLASVPFSFRAAWQEDAGITTRTASTWSEAILILLILLLIGEQAMAFIASFHPTPKAER